MLLDVDVARALAVGIVLGERAAVACAAVGPMALHSSPAHGAASARRARSFQVVSVMARPATKKQAPQLQSAVFVLR